MKAMKRTVLLSVLMIAFVFATANSASAQKFKDLVKQKVEATRGANSDLKDKVPCEMPDVVKSKIKKVKGSWCTIQFQNWTGYYIHIWVDGYYQGQLAPWAKSDIDVVSGWKDVYCETSGGTYSWVSEGDCDGTHSFNLQ